MDRNHRADSGNLELFEDEADEVNDVIFRSKAIMDEPV
jgi:hypothetical protein